jgi:hypothetical protein
MHCNTKKMKSGGPVIRGGRAKLADAERRKMYKDIEDALSEALTGDNPTDKMYRERSFMDKLLEAMEDAEDDSYRRYIERKPVQKKRYGGKVRAMKNGGAVMNGRGPKYKGMK